MNSSEVFISTDPILGQCGQQLNPKSSMESDKTMDLRLVQLAKVSSSIKQTESGMMNS